MLIDRMLDLALQLGPSALFLYARRTQFRSLSVALRHHVSSLDRTLHGSNGYSLLNLTTCVDRGVEIDFTFSVYGAMFHYACTAGKNSGVIPRDQPPKPRSEIHRVRKAQSTERLIRESPMPRRWNLP